MLPENKYIQYGFPRTEEDIKCIVIHNTNNTELSARQLFDYLKDDCKTSQGTHYICDHTETIQVMPDDWAVYNTGKGKDFGCRYGIAIEICDNLNDDLYQQGEDRAISLIFDLQHRYHIPNEMVFFHQDFSPTTYCPHLILDRYGTSTNFVYQRLTESED